MTSWQSLKWPGCNTLMLWVGDLCVITDVTWTFVMLKLSSKNLFLSPIQGSNLQPSDDRWDALIIELLRLRWWAKVQVRHMCYPCASHSVIIMETSYLKIIHKITQLIIENATWWLAKNLVTSLDNQPQVNIYAEQRLPLQMLPRTCNNPVKLIMQMKT